MATIPRIPAKVPEPVEAQLSADEFDSIFGPVTVPVPVDIDFEDTRSDFQPSAFDDARFLD